MEHHKKRAYSLILIAVLTLSIGYWATYRLIRQGVDFTPSAQETGLPDIVIANVFMQKPKLAAGETSSLTFSIENPSLASTGAFTVTAVETLEKESNPGIIISVRTETVAVPNLGPGEIHYTAIAINPQEVGKYTFTIHADSAGVVSESNETNNQVVTSYTSLAPVPPNPTVNKEQSCIPQTGGTSQFLSVTWSYTPTQPLIEGYHVEEVWITNSQDPSVSGFYRKSVQEPDRSTTGPEGFVNDQGQPLVLFAGPVYHIQFSNGVRTSITASASFIPCPTGTPTPSVVIATPTSTLTPTPSIIQDPCPDFEKGDADCDEDIDLADFDCWVGFYHKEQTTKPHPIATSCVGADFNRNTEVSVLDYAIWQIHYPQ